MVHVSLPLSSFLRNLPSMGFFKAKPVETLSHELVERVWDLQGRIKHLEGILDNELEELKKRYARAEQSERRLEQKKAKTPCDDVIESEDQHPAILALKRRQGRVVTPNSLTAGPR